MINIIFVKKIMGKLIEKIYGANRGWWDSFTSCFVGSLLGIGITFAISGYLEYRHKKELEHTIQLMNVADMDLTVDSFKSQEEAGLYLDSLFTEALRYYPDSIYSVPPECLREVYDKLLTLEISGSSNSVENIFNNSLEVWTSTDNLSVLTEINEFYSAKKAAENAFNELISVRKKLFDNLTKRYSLKFSDFNEAVSYLYGSEENMCLMRNYCVYRVAFSNLIPQMEEMMVSIKKKARISDEELHDLIYKDVDDSEDESSSADSESE